MKSPLSKVITFAAFLLSSAGVYAQEDLKSLVQQLPEEDQVELIMSSGTPVTLTDFSTGEKVTIDRIDRLSAEELVKFLPPLQEVYSLYWLYVDQGQKPYSAYMMASTDFLNSAFAD